MSNVIIVGCGRVGSQLATLLTNSGHNVCVVDRDAEAFANLGRSFNGATVQGIGFDEETLIKAGVEECDVVVAATQLDNTNLMIAEVARRIFDVPHAIARLYNPEHERAYMQLGLDYVCGTSLVAEECFAKVNSGVGHHLSAFGDFEILQFSLNLRRVNKDSIRASDLERDHGIRIIAFERSDGSASSIPAKDSVLFNGDSVLACVRHDLVDSFSKYMQD